MMLPYGGGLNPLLFAASNISKKKNIFENKNVSSSRNAQYKQERKMLSPT